MERSAMRERQVLDFASLHPGYDLRGGMFEGFALHRVDTGEVTIRARVGGSGPAVLLLHGNPQTHVMWHKIAPHLAEHFTVVAPDLRGYGESSKPRTAPDHQPYSKRVMARDQLAVMRHFGFETFAVVGHDRGGRVDTEAVEDYWRAFSDPRTVHAICEDYRAGASCDFRLDEADLQTTRIRCPVLVLWGAKGVVGRLYDPLAVWRDWGENVRGEAIDSGHYLAEERPEETLRVLMPFLKST
jgi:pimeloyl-ACP methyl ester carboxylesterase